MPDRPVRVKNESETPNDDPLERNQPDPMLRLGGTGRMGSVGIALVAIFIIVIIGVVAYGWGR